MKKFVMPLRTLLVTASTLGAVIGSVSTAHSATAPAAAPAPAATVKPAAAPAAAAKPAATTPAGAKPAAAPAGAKPATAAAAPKATGFPAECAKPEKLVTEMGESTYAGLQTAMEAMSKKKYDEAIEKLTKMADTGSDYEKAVVNYNLGFAYSSKNDNTSAVKAFAKAISFNALPRTQREQLQYNLGQLYIVATQ
jgi:tetratricopeptide (TPR) repeat protein